MVLALVLALAIGGVVVFDALGDRDDPPATPTPGIVAESVPESVATPARTLVTDRVRATPTGIRPDPTTRPTATPEPTSAAALLPPNELGRVPILMYHAFVHKEENTDEWTLTYDQFRWQLEWLRTHNFVMVSLDSVLTGRIDLPAGKRPVVLTFDDSSAGQFGLRASMAGSFEVQPDSAVGILEAYAAQHPEFAGPAFFAVVPHACFASADDPSTCEQRLRWLSDHGYEIGNHTLTHENLTDLSDDTFCQQIGEAQRWIDARVTGPANLSHVLVLPYGAWPGARHQQDWLLTGFPYDGGQVRLTHVLEVGGGPTSVRHSIRWSPALTRFNTSPSVFQYWADAIVTEEVYIYVSDGDPNVLTVPAGWEEYVHPERLTENGLGLRVLDPDATS